MRGAIQTQRLSTNLVTRDFHSRVFWLAVGEWGSGGGGVWWERGWENGWGRGLRMIMQRMTKNSPIITLHSARRRKSQRAIQHAEGRSWSRVAKARLDSISYSSTDADVAKRLHRKLESYRIPRDLGGRPGRDEPVPRRIFPIFRDRDELPLSADLGSSIEDALRASRYLIVLCSPDSAKSRWVNEEVGYFKSLGREERVLAIILRGIYASDLPGRTEEECFGPALRRRVGQDSQLTDQPVEPIAGDLRKNGDGWRNAFLKAVAGITGLGFDAFAKRQAKRERRKRLVAAACLFILLIAGVWTWDFNRLKIDHFANTTTRWGVPEGVGRLSADLRAGRATHYRFESRRGKVRTVYRMNSVGELRDDAEAHNASEIRVVYLADGLPQAIEYRNRHGQLTTRHTFGPRATNPDGSTTQVITFQDAAGGARTQDARMGTLAQIIDTGSNTEPRSEITAHRVTYDAAGRSASVVFLNAYGFPRANAEGVFGQRLVHGPLGVPTRIEYIDHRGQPSADRRASPLANRPSARSAM